LTHKKRLVLTHTKIGDKYMAITHGAGKFNESDGDSPAFKASV
jgi:hypothetical protein